MSVRRLAAEQPDSFAFTPELEDIAVKLIAKYPEGRQASAVVPLLWETQKAAGGWLPEPAIRAVADRLGMPHIRVLEVCTFYTMFNLEPVGKYFVQLCGTTPCMLRGAEDIKAVCRKKIGEERHITADGTFSWLEVECLGACTNAPMVQINDDYYEDLTPENFEKLLDDLAAGRPVKVGPQNSRHGAEPEGGARVLTDPALYTRGSSANGTSTAEAPVSGDAAPTPGE
ncbi:NADH-quinone oxidoreductase subunit NuoE [Xanthobacter tagetidis]|uniref:NADH-quinone oxidoreductase subunit NuoE n=1 Tax=Xanthobacter tagetidis TaxID=60216 RepID=A0A3L6ZXT5_9HYPH|nr:NADH-quinone oxidoreductase subunit NuoE [Xanthobacter tagetidis]MBB6310105.1 NADH-quinone oxidoreductase subunit E [Xanthobacter tagetidis]RLP72729.1 NADH-quinone oxidoreductase subunit NuoE [Xanthobacter tagetidis]